MNTEKVKLVRAVAAQPKSVYEASSVVVATVEEVWPGTTPASRLSCMLYWGLLCWIAAPVSAIADVTWKPATDTQPEEPRNIPNPLFEDASYSANLYYYQRDSKRYDVETGKFEKNWHHSTIQSTIEINSGYAGDIVGVDFAAIATKDLENSGAPTHERSFVPWRNPWSEDWSEKDARSGGAIYRAHLKFRQGQHWAKLGYFQPSGPGVLGTNWTVIPGTYLGAEAGHVVGRLTTAIAYVTQYKAPWFRDTFRMRQNDGITKVAYLWSLGANYAMTPELSVELAYGESQNYLKSGHLKLKYARQLAAGKSLYLTYQLYTMRDSESGESPNNHFAATARQHYAAMNYRTSRWNLQTDFLKSYAPANRSEHAGYFEYRLVSPYGGGYGAYEWWWDNISSWNHHRETAIFLKATRSLDDLVRRAGWSVSAAVARGWGGKVYGVREKLREKAYTLELGYIVPSGRFKDTAITFHYTHYNNKSQQPSWVGFKNASQDERDLKLFVSIPLLR